MHAVLHDDGDKYNKHSKAGKAGLQKYEEALGCLKQLGAFVGQNAFLAYTVFLGVCAVIYLGLGGKFSEYSVTDSLELASTIAEAFGLLMLRRKIAIQRGVSGISRATIMTYTVVYTMRLDLLMPAQCPPGSSGECLRAWIKEGICVVTVLMVLDILWSVWRTYKATYQEDLDVLKFKYLVPGCCVLALLIHPDLEEGWMYSYWWTLCLYLDVMALMPQVVMMTKGGGKVQAPIAHFVAATFASRCVDLTYWAFQYELVGIYSAVIIVFFHVLHLVLVLDFMYFYARARLSGAGLGADLDLQVADAI